MNPTDKAAALIEALPYLQDFRGKTFLIKMGGWAMEDPDLVAQVMRDIVFLEVAGINPIVVHGGGKAISAAMEKAGLEAKFVGGFRVTTRSHRHRQQGPVGRNQSQAGEDDPGLRRQGRRHSRHRRLSG